MAQEITQVRADPAMPSTSGTASVPGMTLEKRALYVGDLERNVTEGQLTDLFNQVARVESIRVCRDRSTGNSLGYAYVNFANPLDAKNAMEKLNYTPLNGKPIRIMYSNRDRWMRISGNANIFIKNLDSSIDSSGLHGSFASFGTILSAKVAVDDCGRSKGYGFVQFDNEEAATAAINKLNGMLFNDKQVYAGPFVRREERMRVNGPPKFTNVYVKNLSPTTSKEDLEEVFGTYGTITSAVVMKDEKRKSRCFGFVNFDSPDSAVTSVEKLNRTKTKLNDDDKVLYVARAVKKSEREAELKYRSERAKLANLYVKNLSHSIDEQKLREICSEFGTVTSCKIMRDQHGKSRGFGFVAFSSIEDASRAMKKMNGKFELNGELVEAKPLYVAVAERRDERQARQQAQAQAQAHLAQQIQMAQLQAAASIPQQHHQGGYPGAPSVGQHQHQQGTPVATPQPTIPQPGGYGFQQLLPGGFPQQPGPGIHPFLFPGGYGFQQLLPRHFELPPQLHHPVQGQDQPVQGQQG